MLNCDARYRRHWVKKILTHISNLFFNSLQWFEVQIYFFGRGSFCSSQSTMFEKNLQKYLHSFLNQRKLHHSFSMIL